LQTDRGAAAFTGALGRRIATVLTRDGADKVEAQACALGAQHIAAGDPVKAAEDPLEMRGRDADALVSDTDADPGVVLNAEGDPNVGTVG